MMQKQLSLWLLPLAAWCLLAAGCSNDETRDPSVDAATQQQLASLEQQVQYLQTAVASLQELAARTEQLEQALDGQQAAVDALQTLLATLDASVGQLEQQLGAMETALADKVDNETYAQFVAETHEAMQGNSRLLAELTVLLGDLAKRVGDLEESSRDEELAAGLKRYVDESVAALEASIDAVTGLLDNYVLKSAYAAFIGEYAAFQAEINSRVEANAERIGATEERIAGLSDEVAEHDTQLAELRSMLEMLQEQESGDIVETARKIAEIESRMAQLQREREALEQNMEAIEANLQEQLTQLAENQLTMEEVEALFAEKSEELLGDIGSRVDAALAEALERALAEDAPLAVSIANLVAEKVDGALAGYTGALDELTQRVEAAEEALRGLEEALAALEGRLTLTEGQIADLLRRIQSLVYVPKTADGIIHVGTTYLAATDADGNETGSRIELTPTKKLEYRVSPAALAEDLIRLWQQDNGVFSFYQEHVTPMATRAEVRSMDEFHIVQVEPGNGPGEMLLTVDCDHDFTHEDLAVALCIRYTSENGVATEFTSPYTTVVGDGRNVLTRFYVARKAADGTYHAVRDDDLNYILPWTDSATHTLLGTDYEVVYDNGESVMSLAEAKARFEWEADLSWSKQGVAGAFSTTLPMSGMSTHTVSPQEPNSDRSKAVSFSLKPNAGAGNLIGYELADAYDIVLSDGRNSVTVLPGLSVRVVICDHTYAVEASTNAKPTVTWDYSKWEGAIGRPEGDTTPYRTPALQPIASTSLTSTLYPDRKYDHLSEKVLKELFDTDAGWTIPDAARALLKGDVQIRNTEVQYDAGRWKTQFTVEGYIYSENSASAQNNTAFELTRSVRPAHLLGNTPITLKAADFTFDAPPVKTIAIDATLTAKSGWTPLFYIAVSDNITNAAKKLNYSAEEIEKYFDGKATNISTSELLNRYRLNFSEWSGGDGLELPMALSLFAPLKEDATSTAYRYPALGANTSAAAVASISESVEFTAPADAAVEIENGPTFRIAAGSKITLLPAR